MKTSPINFFTFLSRVIICTSCLMLIVLNINCAFDVHTQAVIEYFKDKNKLSMVLGAGDAEHDYVDLGTGEVPKARFKNYTFVVNKDLNETISKRLLKSTTKEEAIKELGMRLSGGQKEPIPLNLDLDSTDFFDFLKEFKGRFKEIIFDQGVAKFIGLAYISSKPAWNKLGLKVIFDALEDGGVFCIDQVNYCSLISEFFRNVVALHNIKIENNVMSYSVSNLKNFIIQQNYSIQNVPQDIVAGENVTERLETNAKGEVIRNFYAPSEECRRNHAINLLKSVGFEAEYKENASYPLNNPWPEYVKIDFSKYNYIYAKKPVSLTKKIVDLKVSLSQLNVKLIALKSKLKTLKEKINKTTSADILMSRRQPF